MGCRSWISEAQLLDSDKGNLKEPNEEFTFDTFRRENGYLFDKTDKYKNCKIKLENNIYAVLTQSLLDDKKLYLNF